MYINAQLQTCSVKIPGAVPLTDNLAAKLAKYRPCAKAVIDETGTLVDIEYDEEKAAEIEADQAEQATETALRNTRRLRRKYLNAFDIYKSNLQYFGGTETEEGHETITAWYNELLGITDNVTAEGIPEFPEVPAGIKEYL